MAVKIGLVGTGTVGGGCIDIIQKHKDDFLRHFGVDIELARVCSLSPAEAEAHGVGHLFTDNFNNIINDPEIDIVVELIGGTTIARTVVLNALAAGKNVVTANKALMATHGKEVMEAAEAAGKELAFEASVGGGIPIIDPLKHSLIANEITSVMGIVNGTTNYMLTRMADNGLSYEDALHEAQQKGFAEADPTADVGGFDAAAKIAILASIAFNSRVTLDDVFTDGITNISPVDIEAARDMGYVIKLLAIAHRREDGVDVRVHPTMIPTNHQLATVNGVFNAIYVVGDFVGETMFFGEGAGAGADLRLQVLANLVNVGIVEHARMGLRRYLHFFQAIEQIPARHIEFLRQLVYAHAGHISLLILSRCLGEGKLAKNALVIFVGHFAAQGALKLPGLSRRGEAVLRADVGAAAGEVARRVEAHKALAVAHDAVKRALPKGRAAADAGALALCRLCCHQVLPLRPLPRHRHGRRSTGCSVGRGCGSGCRPRRRRCRSRRPPPPRRPSRHRPKTHPGSSGA